MDYKFIHNEKTNKWVILSPRRAKRPNEKGDLESSCPFCSGNESKEKEAYRIPENSDDSNWKVRVIPNKFPFAPIHEIVIHSQDHHKNFDELPLDQNQLILQAYRNRFREHQDKGQVCIFHNSGEAAGQSQPHPHSQIVVIPDFVKLDVPELIFDETQPFYKTEHFVIFAPDISEWPDEVWVKPVRDYEYFSGTNDEELKDLARLIYRLIQIFDLRHGHEFPFNFYISPHKQCYLRLIPRSKIIGGFELATNIWVNTQDPKETMEFIKKHFDNPNEELIKQDHQAKYHRAV